MSEPIPRFGGVNSSWIVDRASARTARREKFTRFGCSWTSETETCGSDVAPAQMLVAFAILGIVRRSQVGELGKQIAMGLYLVPGHPSVCEDSQEGISGVVGERPTIVRK